MKLPVHLLKGKSIAYRKTLLSAIARAGAGHTGGSLSCLDILNVLYNRVMDITPHNFAERGRDHYVQSKGHSVEALYTVLTDQGFFPLSEMDTLGRGGSHFIGHPTRKVPGIEHNTGALGHGLAVAVGLALAAKMDGQAHRVYTLLGDGELAEGSVWEASLTAAHYQLDNLVVIVDRNRLQISGPTESVMALEPLAAKFSAFGYAVERVNGHDLAALVDVFGRVPFVSNKPNLILAETTKGAGISFMENQVNWHHHVPTAEELAAALQELDAAAALLEQEKREQEQMGREEVSESATVDV